MTWTRPKLSLWIAALLLCAALIAVVTVPARIAAAADNSPPTVPVVVQTAGTATEVQVDWAPASDDVAVAGYLVHRDWQFVAWVDAGTTFVDDAVVAGQAYRYEIRAQDASGNNSAPSTPEIVTAGSPTVDEEAPTVPVVTNTVGASNQIQIDWSPSSDDVEVVGYLVHRDYQYLAWVEGAESFVDTSVTPFETYSYRIRAQDAVGNNSGPSVLTTVVAGADITAPTSPPAVSATTSASEIELTWEPATDDVAVVGHLVHRDGVFLDWVSAGLTYTDATVVDGQTYLYEVRAQDAAGNNSDPSPLTVTAANGGGDITLVLSTTGDGAVTTTAKGLLVGGEVEAEPGDSIERLDVTIEQVATGRSWTGDDFETGVNPFRLAIADEGVRTTGYSVRIGSAQLAPGDYAVSVTATSAMGAGSMVGPVTVSVTGETPIVGAPESTILRPFDSVPLPDDVDLVVRGYSIDPDGVAGVDLTITRSGQWWNGTQWVGAPTSVAAQLTDPGESTTSWSETIPAAQSAAGDLIEVVVEATDQLGTVESHNVIPRPRNSNQHTTRVALPIYAVAPGALRLAVFGDSITQQGGGFGFEVPGHRYELEQMFQAGDCNVDWVGSLDWNWNEDVRKQPDWTDRQHDGISSWSLYHTKNYVAFSWQQVTSPTGNRPGRDLAAATGADIVLVHMGTNGTVDVTQDGLIPGLTADEVAQQKAIYNTIDMQLLVDDIRAALGPDTPIFLAQIINSHRPTAAPVPPLDTPAMINQYVNQGYADIAAADPNIFLVDMATGYDPLWNLDGLHPGNVGALEMANRWRDSLDANSALGGCL